MEKLFYPPLEVAIACTGNELSQFERRCAMIFSLRLGFMTLVVMALVC